MWRERNFGAHCLNALKKEVHGAEHTEVQRSKDRQQTPERQPANEAKTSMVITKKELPPWLQSRRRAREKTEQPLVADTPAVVSEGASEVIVHSISIATSGRTNAAPMQEPLAASNQKECLPQRGSLRLTVIKCNISKWTTSNSKASHNESIDAPDTWEEAAESDASTAEPGGTEEIQEVEASKTLKLFAKVGNHTTSYDLDDGSEHCEAIARLEERSEPQVCEPSSAIWDKESSTGARLKIGRHSRFRKDMVNFNKAVTKWLRQENKGEITHSLVLHKIVNSSVAQQLRVLHGPDFNEDRFVQDTYEHASRGS